MCLSVPLPVRRERQKHCRGKKWTSGRVKGYVSILAFRSPFVNTRLVPERDRRGMALGVAPILVGVAKVAAGGFGPLKAALEDLYTNYKVRL